MSLYIIVLDDIDTLCYVNTQKISPVQHTGVGLSQIYWHNNRYILAVSSLGLFWVVQHHLDRWIVWYNT